MYGQGFNLPSWEDRGWGWTPGMDPSQLYGLEDLDRLHEGFENLFDQQYSMLPSNLKGDWADYFSPASYNPDESQESFMRDAWAEDVKSYKGTISSYHDQAYLDSQRTRANMGRAGFAGGGTASDNLMKIGRDFALRKEQSREGLLAEKAAAEKGVLQSRKAYTDNLWNQWSMFQSALDPTGDHFYHVNYDDFFDEYIHGSWNYETGGTQYQAGDPEYDEYGGDLCGKLMPYCPTTGICMAEGTCPDF